MTQNKLHIHCQMKVKHTTTLVRVYHDTQQTVHSLSAESETRTQQLWCLYTMTHNKLQIQSQLKVKQTHNNFGACMPRGTTHYTVTAVCILYSAIDKLG